MKKLYVVFIPILILLLSNDITAQINIDGTITDSESGYFSISNIYTDINDRTTQIPSNFLVLRNYPNPFNPSTTIKYSIPQVNVVTENIPSVQLKIFDILGREVATLVNQKQKPGSYEVVWNAEEVPSGVYFYQIRTAKFVETKKMILLR